MKSLVPRPPGKDRLPRITLLALLAAAPLYLLLYFLLDRPVARWAGVRLGGTWVSSLGAVLSLPGDSPILQLLLAAGALAALFGVYLPGGGSRRWPLDLFYVWTSTVVAGLITQSLKILLGRCRPELLLSDDLYGLCFLTTSWELNSTPSGHSALAFASMTALSLLLPRARAAFLTLALLVGASRVAVSAHYPSDVLFGGLIGAFTALWFHRLFYPGLRRGETAGRLTPG